MWKILHTFHFRKEDGPILIPSALSSLWHFVILETILLPDFLPPQWPKPDSFFILFLALLCKDQPSSVMECAMFHGLPQSENKSLLVSAWLIYRINLIPDLLIPFYPTLRTRAEQRPEACFSFLFVCFSKFWGEKCFWDCQCSSGQDSHMCSSSHPIRGTVLGIIPSLPFISSCP